MPGFVGGNLRFMFEGEADIVQPLEQAMANEFIHRELRGEAPVVTHFAAFEVNRELIILRLTGSPDQLRDFGILDGAVMRPQASAFGEDAFPSIHEKAAALLHSLARNHPFVTANKRPAWTAAWSGSSDIRPSRCD